MGLREFIFIKLLSLAVLSEFKTETRKEYFEITWASLRAMVEPSFGKRSVINHKDYLRNGRIIASKAINITDTDVLTADGGIFPFDYLVIATGHVESVPKTRAERLAEYEAGKTGQELK